QQFQAILIQMLMRSVRDANKAMESNLFGSDDMEHYQDMFDKQLSLIASGTGLGFADMIEKNIDLQYGKQMELSAAMQALRPQEAAKPAVNVAATASKTAEPVTKSAFSSPKEFIKSL